MVLCILYTWKIEKRGDKTMAYKFMFCLSPIIINKGIPFEVKIYGLQDISTNKLNF